MSTRKATKWVDGNEEEDLACPLSSANKQATLKFVIKKKPSSSAKKCKSKQTDFEAEYVVMKKNDGDENNETELASPSPNKNKEIKTPKRRLFTNGKYSRKIKNIN